MSSPETGEPKTYLIVRIRQSLMAVPIQHVVEVLAQVEITAIPAWNEPLLGVINARGGWLAIADIGPRLGYGAVSQGLRSYIVVVTDGPLTVGLLADGVRDIYTMNARELAAISELPSAVPAAAKLCVGLIYLDDGPVPVLAPLSTLLWSAERAAIATAASPALLPVADGDLTDGAYGR